MLFRFQPGKLNMNNFGNIANAMASMQVNEEGGYAVPKDMIGKGNEYAQPVVDKPPGGGGGGKSKLRKHREQQLAMQKGDYCTKCVTFHRLSSSRVVSYSYPSCGIIHRPRNEMN